jgi:Ser/Thr protein kinase RdoA (MazF antagonist)
MERMQPPGWLGDELAQLAGELPAPIVALEPIAGSGSCATIRLTLADGTMLKARRLADAGHALRIEQLLQQLAHPSFPAVRARRGAVIVTDWVPGRTLASIEVDLDLLRSCGALHAFVHMRRIEPDVAPWRSPVARVRLQSSLDALVLAAVISRSEADAATRIALRHAPGACAAGLVHGDLNAENVIRNHAGGLVVVDNETLSTGAYAYDLARTWYRWPMADAQWSAYLAGYTTACPGDDIEAHLPFWRIAVLARGAAFRLRATRPQLDVPIARLRAQLEAWR